jgi:predicted metal-dependent phosphoesterase TrpH
LTFHFMIDLHLHTTASDGHCSPPELVDRASAAGLAVIAVTDHDTTAGVAEVQAHARRAGMLAIAGIEITAVDQHCDVHVLGYFFDPSNAALVEFLAAQRAVRTARVAAIGERLAALGLPVDLSAVLEEARRETGRSIGRPKVAKAMIDAGYVADTREAFDKWLGTGCPAFIPRTGAVPEEVIAIVHHAGGIASLAHPGRTAIDARIHGLRNAGLDALEVYHSDHDSGAVTRYGQVARELGLLTTGGSDFHGDPSHGLEPGGATLPREEWERLFAARDRYAAR